MSILNIRKMAEEEDKEDTAKGTEYAEKVERARLAAVFSANLKFLDLRLQPTQKMSLLRGMAQMTLQGGSDMPGHMNLLNLSWMLLPHGTVVMRRWGFEIAVGSPSLLLLLWIDALNYALICNRMPRRSRKSS